MIWATYSFLKSFYSLSMNCRPDKLIQLTAILEKTMIFSVSNDGIQWTLDFGPDSVTITVKSLDQNITIGSQEIPLAAWKLLLSQRQNLLSNHLARVPITPNQEGTMEMRDEVLSNYWTTICHESQQALRTKRKQWRWQTKNSLVWGLKTWILAAFKCPIPKTLRSVGKILQSIWTAFIDLELIPRSPRPSPTIFTWDQPLPTQY